jgi:glyceraldehyde-3-phosphate dehydrogenase type I
MVERTIGIFGAGGEIGRNILRINAMREEPLPITHLVEGFHTRDALVELLRNDPVRGSFPGEVGASGRDSIVINGKSMEFIQSGADKMVDWKDFGVWGVLESSGLRVQEESAMEHITDGGAEKVLVTAPTKGPKAQTVIVGYNEDQYDPDGFPVATNESCTTKSALHPAHVLNQAFGLRAINLATVHAETGGEKRSLIERMGRVDSLAELGFNPQSTGSQGALSKLFPGVEVSAVAYRVPVTDGSISDIIFKLARRTSERNALKMLKESVKPGIWKIVEDIRSSTSLLNDDHDAVIDEGAFQMTDENLVRVRSGYDNAYAPARAALDAMAHMRGQ